MAAKADILKQAALYVDLKEEEQEAYTARFSTLRVKKKQFIVQPGFPCRHRTFIVQGAFRSFLYDQHAHEHTIAFAIEGWWISDFNSYIFQTPATLFVEALEDATIMQMDFETEQELLAGYPVFEKLFRVMAQRALAAAHRRSMSRLSKTAEERYQEFAEKHPQIAFRVPQYTLASYLGISTEYLSKIRNKKLRH